MIKAVVFDLDNTLVDFYRVKRASCGAAIDAMIDAGLEMDRQKATELLFELYEQYGIEYKQIFQEFLIQAIGKVDWKILASGIVAYRRSKAGALETYPGVKATLIQLKSQGIRLAILSDAPRMNAYIRLASLRLLDFFDIVITTDDTGVHKPDPKAFETVLKALQLPANEVLMVGYWPERDIQGAKAAGMKTCYARYGAVRKGDEIPADFALNAFRELLEVVGTSNNN